MEEIKLLIDPVLMSRLKIVYAFQKNTYNVDLKPSFEKWIVEEIALLVGNEELRIANQSYYSQKSVPEENINKPQYVAPPYVEPAEYIFNDEDEYSDSLARVLGVLDLKKDNKHIYWDCCSCSHCVENEDEDDDYSNCACHEACRCWCDDIHYVSNSIIKDGIKYKWKAIIPDMKCPGHVECKSLKRVSTFDVLYARKNP